MKKNYLILLFTFLVVNVFAQKDVTFNVTDDVTLLPISGVDITADGVTLTTDINGEATFSLAPNTSYPYTTSANCYLDSSGTVVVGSTNFTEFITISPITQTDATIFFFLNAPGEPAIFSPVDVTLTGINGNTNNYSFTYDYNSFEEAISGVAYGDYEITYSGDCRSTSTSSVTVSCDAYNNPNPGVIEQFDTIGGVIVIDTSVTQNNEVLTANANGASISYQWVDCNNGNAPIDGETNQVFTAAVNGSYAVIITDSNCPDSQISTCYDVNSLSISENNASFEVKFYPNPVEEELNISLGQSFDNINLQVYSISGQLIEQFTVYNGFEFKVNMSRYPSGTYLVKIDTDEKSKTRIIIKK